MNKFTLEPTDENLERFKRFQDGKAYWHTADFFHFDCKLSNELSIIFDVYIDKMMESVDDNDEVIIHKIEFSIARMLVKAARETGISPQDYRDQFNNYAMVVWTPICIWYKDESGNIRHCFRNNLAEAS